MDEQRKAVKAIANNHKRESKFAAALKTGFAKVAHAVQKPIRLRDSSLKGFDIDYEESNDFKDELPMASQKAAVQKPSRKEDAEMVEKFREVYKL